jgi:uncharacterized repeat protein (TIGR03803 family)
MRKSVSPSVSSCSALALAGAMMLAQAPAQPANAGKFRVLYVFQGGTDASGPIAGVIERGKLLYGTTYFGGTNNLGTVYSVAADGTESVIHSFGSGTDGANPQAGLVADAKGNLYGTTYSGGAKDRGTVFKITPKGKETVLYSFCPNYPHCTDGFNVSAGLILDANGNLYGTSYAGGANSLGTVFKVASDGTQTVLYSFKGGSDGADPSASVIADSQGNLYGTTYDGGNTNCYGAGCGTVFKLATDGTESVLYAFQGGSDGANPFASLIMDATGNLYGTTWSGGSTTNCSGSGCGTVFEVATNGTETILHAFSGGSDGMDLQSPLTADENGNLYGTTDYGGNTSDCSGNGCGTVFKLAPDGTKTVLHAFAGSDGAQPGGQLLAEKKGELYAATYNGGGSCDCGVVFRVKE